MWLGARVGLSPTQTSPASVGEQFCGLGAAGRQRKPLLIPNDKGQGSFLSASQRTPATLVLSAQVDKCSITSAEAADGTAGIWGWRGSEWLSWGLEIALHLLLNHQTLRKGQESTMWPQARTPCDTGPSAAWGSSQGAQGSKAQVGSVSFMPLGVIVWTPKQLRQEWQQGGHHSLGMSQSPRAAWLSRGCYPHTESQKGSPAFRSPPGPRGRQSPSCLAKLTSAGRGGGGG